MRTNRGLRKPNETAVVLARLFNPNQKPEIRSDGTYNFPVLLTRESRCNRCGVKTEPFINELLWPGLKVSKMLCEKCYEVVRKERAKAEVLRQENESRLKSAGLPDMAATRTFETFHVMAGVREALEKCQKWIPTAKGRGLYLHGPTGSGKTHLALAVAQNLLTKNVSVKYISSPRLSLDLWTYRFDQSQTVRNLRGFAVLIIDDAGQEETSPRFRGMMWTVINDRIEYGKHLVVTSNWAPTDDHIIKHFGEPVASRFLDLCETVVLSPSEDYRYRRVTLEAEGQFDDVPF